MKITLAQLNPIIGDVNGNLKQITKTITAVAQQSPDLIVFPELVLSGYPPHDLLERSAFIRAIQASVRELVLYSRGFPQIGVLFGAPLPTDKDQGKGLYNSALLIQNGEIIAQVNKSLLPTYDVFDEARYFDIASAVLPVAFKNELLGISICEDAWNNPEQWYRPIYIFDPISQLVDKGATLLLNISASPFSLGKDEIRYRLYRNHALKHHRPFVSVNQVGGNDELVFDGSSMVLNAAGELMATLPSFQTACATVDLANPTATKAFEPLGRIASLYDALTLGLHDYVEKNSFKGVLIGLSGGIDSAVTCTLAVAALGAEKVWGVAMPSQISSVGSVRDAEQLAKNLEINFRIVPIQNVFNRYLKELQPHFAGRPADTTEENIQARIRGNFLMALSNKYGFLVLATGNKSELAMGYCTLYGDMSGGLGVISDVPKTMIYDLARYINRDKEIIPAASLTKPPSAELRPNQTDQDSLPPYEILDAILYQYLQEGQTAAEIIAKGFDRETVYRVIQTIDCNEYKRRQAAPGLKVTSKAFVTGRRMPLAAKYTQSWG